MQKRTQLLLLISSVLLISVYFLPLWSIDLQAPQYPEGIGIRIMVNDITGKNPHDLRNINQLNHYIGMKEIHAESIPELKIMPYIFGFLICLGGAGFFINRRFVLVLWIAIFVIAAATGMVDFYLWEYDYGHNLNPDAAIKIPGMSYQPPLLGTKQILNMKTTSLPASGGIVAFISLCAGAFALYSDIKNKKV